VGDLGIAPVERPLDVHIIEGGVKSNVNLSRAAYQYSLVKLIMKECAPSEL
jgi:hypothetical protein